MLGYIQNKLAIAYRTRLTEAAVKQYLGENEGDESKVFYKMGECSGWFLLVTNLTCPSLANLDDRIKNADQYAISSPDGRNSTLITLSPS